MTYLATSHATPSIFRHTDPCDCSDIPNSSPTAAGFGLSRLHGLISKYALKLYRSLSLREAKPHTLFLACAESHDLSRLLSGYEAHELFTHRNIGNFVPPSVEKSGRSPSAILEGTIRYAVETLKVKEIIVCGHSECCAMKALLSGDHKQQGSSIASWLRLGHFSLKSFFRGSAPDPTLSAQNQLSQVNIIQQLYNLRTYDDIERYLGKGQLRLRGWYFDTEKSRILEYNHKEDLFMVTPGQEGLFAEVAAA